MLAGSDESIEVQKSAKQILPRFFLLQVLTYVESKKTLMSTNITTVYFILVKRKTSTNAIYPHVSHLHGLLLLVVLAV